MFDQLIDGVRKASESSLQMQQEMFKHWTKLFTGPAQDAGAQAGAQAEWGRTSQKRWLELGVEMLNRHREAVDSIYKSGIQLIEQTFHVTDAKSPDDYRQMVEDLWRKLFDLQKQQSENQFRDFQTFYEKSASLVQDARV
jgi:hypothetical protein